MVKFSKQLVGLLVALVAATRIATPIAAAAQASGGIAGIVVDGSGGGIGGAQVTVRAPDGSVRGRATTNEIGEFSFSGLPLGPYAVDVEKALFDVGHVNVDVAAAAAPALRVTLRIAGVSETVDVAVPKLDERPTGQTVTTIDRSQLKDVTGFSIGEVVVFSPGVTVSQGNGPRDVSVSVRGSNVRQTFGIRNIQVLEDGFPVTQPDGLARTDLADPHAYGGIDVFRGPSSALYGNYAIEGAVNFRTRTGGEINGVEGGVDGGSFGYRNLYGAYGHKAAEYEIAAFASRVSGDGFTSHSSYSTTTQNVLATYTPSGADKFTFKFVNNDLFTNLSIRLSLNQFNANPFQAGCADLTGPSCATVSVFSNGFTGAKVGLSADQAGLQRHDRRTIVGARWERTINGATAWRTQLVFDNRDITQPTSASSAVGTYPSFNFTSDVTQKGSLGSLKATHFVGVFGNYENISGLTYNLMPGGNATLGGLTATTYGHHLNAGARAREEIQFGSHWTGIFGIGFEHTGLNALNTGYTYSATASPTTLLIQADRSLANVAPEAAVFYRPTPAIQIRGGIATGYGTPQATNLFVTPDGVNGNNTALQSQTNVGFDYGADVRVGSWLNASVASYYEAYRNELVSQSPGANLLSYTFNAPKSVHRGFELTADTHPVPAVPGTRVLVSYTWMDQHYDEYVERLSAGSQSVAFDRSGNKIPGVIPNYLNARLGYDQPTGVLKGLGGYVELNYRDAAFMDNANLIQAPNYTLWNLNFHFDPKGGNSQGSGVHVIAEVRNLTDQVYVASASNLSDSISSTTGLQNPASTLANSGGIWAGAKRSLFVGLRIKL